LFIYQEKKLLKFYLLLKQFHPLLFLSLTENYNLKTKNYFPPHPNPLPPRGEGKIKIYAKGIGENRKP
jgi:hypothetical protein